ncbi:hypothetical protein [Tumebacillus permanentifrigoris]|uniref:Uncharacterized protein n=1 Tax=Tumebacillus permanentifrigoris TaxID=378543 RepID=A0A316D9U0_9BACL|nr:hypothetical protein [Tumebacillus permanentifrigoris]PWK13961.1 hypothetical protein C7459_106259 [Tumebacillus permanentifrigoris]
MKNSTKILSATLVVAVVSTFGYVFLEKKAPFEATSAPAPVAVQKAVADQQEKTDPNQPLITVPESEYPIIGSHGSFWVYTNLGELYQNADIVAEINVVDQETVPIDIGDVSTCSQVSVVQVYKGDSVPSTLLVTEVGGVQDLSKLPKLDKPGSGQEPKNPQGMIEDTLEGSPVMKPGNSYVVFLTKNPNPKWGYNIVGSVQGKLKIDSKTKKIVNTVAPAYVTQDMFFLQRQFNGKDMIVAENLIKQAK